MKRHIVIWIALAVQATSLISCSSSEGPAGDGATPSETASLAAFPSLVPGGMQVPDPSAMLPVAGREQLVQPSTASPTTVDGISQIRNATATYEGTMSDERVSGTRIVTFNLDERADGSGSLWGTSVIRNEGGSWSGTWTGIMSKAGKYRYYFEDFAGAGAYEGLTYHRNSLSEGAAKEAVPGEMMETSGWLEASDGSAVLASGTPTSSSMTPVSGYARFKSKGREWVFSSEMTDPRVSVPTATIVVADPLRGDQSTDYTETFLMSSSQGGWVCSGGIGSRGAGGTEHQTYCAAKGTGANDGLVYHTQWHFFEPLTSTSRIAATGWIEQVG